MKTFYTFAFLFFILAATAQFNYQRAWGTYYGGNSFFGSLVKLDLSGNTYVIGAVNGPESPEFYSQYTTIGAQQQFTYYKAVILKLSPTGVRQWCTFIGVDNTSENSIGDIAFDADGNVYACGSLWSYSGEGIITEPADFNIYEGLKKGFLAKFTPNGELIYGKWLPFSAGSMKITSNNEILFSGTTQITSGITTPGVFQENIDIGSNEDAIVIARYSIAGTKIWATYCGVGDVTEIDIDESQNIYLAGISTHYDNFLATPGAFQQQTDFPDLDNSSAFLTKFSPTGQRIWSTYYGLYDNIHSATGIADIKYKNGFLYLCGGTNVPEGIATDGSYQTASTAPFIYQNSTASSNTADGFVTKFDTNGNRIWGTYYGGEKADGVQSIAISDTGILISGSTKSADNITTPDGIQLTPGLATKQTPFIAQISEDGTIRKWGTYYGGTGGSLGLYLDLQPDNSFYVAGTTYSDHGVATPGAYQPLRNTGTATNTEFVPNMMIGRFDPLPLSTQSFTTGTLSLYPNPCSGTFYLSESLEHYSHVQISVSDMRGRQVMSPETLQGSSRMVQLPRSCEAGMYLVNITAGGQHLKKLKLIVK